MLYCHSSWDLVWYIQSQWSSLLFSGSCTCTWSYIAENTAIIRALGLFKSCWFPFLDLMVCIVCGSSSHNIRTCLQPGAKVLLRTQAKLRESLKLNREQQSGRRPPRLGKFALRESHKKKQTAAYSGPAKSVRDKKVDQLRRRKTQALPWNAQSQIEALEELICLGFVTVTASCPECTGCLGDFSCKPSGQVYVRCKEYACRKSFNGLNFASWLPHVPHCLTPLQVLQALKVWCHAGISKKISAYVPGLPSVILSFGRLCYTSSKTMTNWKALIFVVSQDMAGFASLCRKHVQTMLSIAQQCLRCGCWQCQDHECEHASFWNYRSGWNFNSHHSCWLSQSHFSTPGESVEGYAHFQWKATAEIFPPACTFSRSCGTWKVSKPRAGSSTIQISFCWSKATDRKLGRHLFYQVAAASPNRVETVSQPNFDGRWCKSMEWSCACWRKKTEN